MITIKQWLDAGIGAPRNTDLRLILDWTETEFAERRDFSVVAIELGIEPATTSGRLGWAWRDDESSLEEHAAGVNNSAKTSMVSAVKTGENTEPSLAGVTETGKHIFFGGVYKG